VTLGNEDIFAECLSVPSVQHSVKSLVAESLALPSAALGKSFFAECPTKGTRQRLQHSVKPWIPVVVGARVVEGSMGSGSVGARSTVGEARWRSQPLGKGVRSHWGSALAFTAVGEWCHWWGENNTWGGICGATAGVEGGRGFGARVAAAACASRQPLGKGAVGGEKATRGEEFGVRPPALKAACGGRKPRVGRQAGARWGRASLLHLEHIALSSVVLWSDRFFR
jgi:hypothetical protein